MNESALPELPGGWVWTRLEEIGENDKYAIVDGPFGSHLKISDYIENGVIPVISISNIDEGFDDDKLRYISREKFETIKRSAVKPGDIIVAKIGSSYGKSGFYPEWMLIGIIPANLLKITVSKSIDKLFVFYYLRTFTFKKKLDLITKSTAQPAFNVSSFRTLSFPLPPLPEQRRIVTKLEELFTRLDAGVSELKKTQAQLKRYSQSVLKAACEGKLVPTEAELAKIEGRGYEPADELLNRILKVRREKWNGKGKYKEPAAPDIIELPELPEGWKWASLEQLSWDSGYGTSEKCDYHFQGPPVLRIPNINEGKIVLDDLKFASTNLNDTESLKNGDMLVIRTNGSKNLIGRAGVVTQDYSKPHFFASYLIRFRIVELGGMPIWLSSIWHTFRIRSWIERVAATSAGQYNISMSTLNRLSLELPPLAEQRRIVAEVERRLSISDGIEKTVGQSLAQAQRLRQSILKMAFEGRLVAQDASDEPAGVLLERIRQEKARAGEKKRKR